jgi:hypothetical protein
MPRPSALITTHCPPFPCSGSPSTSSSAPERGPSSSSAPPPSVALPRPAHSLVPGRDSTVRKMVKPKATRCAKIPLPLRSQRVNLGSLAGAGTRSTSSGCMAVPGRPAQSSCQRRLPGLRSRRRRRLHERLLPGTPQAVRRRRPQRPLGVGGEAHRPHGVAPRNPDRPNSSQRAACQTAYGNYICGE